MHQVVRRGPGIKRTARPPETSAQRLWKTFVRTTDHLEAGVIRELMKNWSQVLVRPIIDNDQLQVVIRLSQYAPNRAFEKVRVIPNRQHYTHLWPERRENIGVGRKLLRRQEGGPVRIGCLIYLG